MTKRKEQKLKCVAHTSQGKPCKNAPIQGGRVCRMHGGAAPQVKRATAERLRALQSPAVDQLAKILEDPKTDNVAKLRAIENVLDRTGLPRNAEVTVNNARDTLLEKLRAMREE